MLYMETNSLDPTWNLALEEAAQEWDQNEEIMMLWQNDNAIIVGRYQNAEKEINFDAANRLGVKVVRRSTGGGTVYHDLGNLNYSFIRPVDYTKKLEMTALSKPMEQALNFMGIPALAQGRNDITLEGKKISGTAQRIHSNRLLHHGTLLFDSNLDVLMSVLNVDPTKIISKGINSVRSRVTNIREHVSPEQFPDMKTFWSGLIDAFAKESPLTRVNPPAELLDKARFLQETKYQTWEWNFGSAPAFQYRNTKRYPGGNLEIDINVENGLISQCRICGDFLGLVELDELENSFIGLKFSETDVLKKLQAVDLSPYLGSITAEEVVDCLFLTA
ncbi:MAG: lipoate--protein ligase [Chloroflexi bacterium]|nr:lipoate--protein ligase [Chloroflexota bacterium]